MTEAGCIYAGSVVHKRLRPKPHALRYEVFSLLLDADRIDSVAGNLWLFSRNRRNFFSFYDGDHGHGEGRAAGDHARGVFHAAGIDTQGYRIWLLAYPRVLGYVFNPISVYYGVDAHGVLSGLIYEVNNTYGERTSYVVRAGEPEGHIFHHGARKSMDVSPFADRTGHYGFRVTLPGETLLLGVQLRDQDGPLIKTHFNAKSLPLSDGNLAWLLIRMPFMTLKVITAIHYEALKLWLKGIPLVKRRPTSAYSVRTSQAKDSL